MLKGRSSTALFSLAFGFGHSFVIKPSSLPVAIPARSFFTHQTRETTRKFQR
jgi:hypothetical protein